MPKLRERPLPKEELRSRRFEGAIASAKLVKGMKSYDDLAAVSNFGSGHLLSYHARNRYESLSIEQLRALIRALNLSGEAVCDWLGAKIGGN